MKHVLCLFCIYCYLSFGELGVTNLYNGLLAQPAGGISLLYAQTSSCITHMDVFITEKSSSQSNPLTSSEMNSILTFYHHPACLSFHFENKLIPQASLPDLQVVKFCLLFFRLRQILIITCHVRKRHTSQHVYCEAGYLDIMQMEEIRQLFLLFFIFSEMRFKEA